MLRPSFGARWRPHGRQAAIFIRATGSPKIAGAAKRSASAAQSRPWPLRPPPFRRAAFAAGRVMLRHVIAWRPPKLRSLQDRTEIGQFHHGRRRAARPPVVKMVPLQYGRQQRRAVNDEIGAARPAHARINDAIAPRPTQRLAERLRSRVALRGRRARGGARAGLADRRLRRRFRSSIRAFGSHAEIRWRNMRAVWCGDRPFRRSRSRSRRRNTRRPASRC